MNESTNNIDPNIGYTNNKYYYYISILYVFCLIIANVAETKSINFKEILDISGSVIFLPMLYIIGDIVTEAYGFKACKRIIHTAIFFNILYVICIYYISIFPSPKSWNGAKSFELLFAADPTVFLASIIGIYIGSILNAYLLAWLKIYFNGQIFVARALFSTLIATICESAIFSITLLFNKMPFASIFDVIYFLVTVKIIYQLVSMPFAVSFIQFLRRKEKINIYDKPTIRIVFPASRR